MHNYNREVKTMTKEIAQSLIEHNKKWLGEKLFNQILNDPRDYNYKFFNMLVEKAKENK